MEDSATHLHLPSRQSLHEERRERVNSNMGTKELMMMMIFAE